MNETNSNLVYAYRDDIGNYGHYRIASTDGLSTVTATDAAPTAWGWANSFVRSLTDSTLIYAYYGGYSRTSSNFGKIFSTLTFNNNNWVWYPWLDNYVNPQSSSYFWYGDSGKLSEGYIYGTGTDISSRLTSIVGYQAGMELYSNSGTWTLRVIGAGGKLAVSTNGAASFSATGSSLTSLTSCNIRQLTSLSTNRNVIVSSCSDRGSYMNTGILSWSRDGGTTWTEASIQGCNGIGGHVQTATKIFVSCSGDTTARISPPIISIDY